MEVDKGMFPPEQPEPDKQKDEPMKPKQPDDTQPITPYNPQNPFDNPPAVQRPIEIPYGIPDIIVDQRRP